jgi:hypothetical protein
MPEKHKAPIVVRFPYKGPRPKHRQAPKQPSPKEPPKDSSGPPADRRTGDLDNQRAMLHETFGGLLRIHDKHGYMLDGKPIKYPELMKLAKRVRKKCGLTLDAKYWRLW